MFTREMKSYLSGINYLKEGELNNLSLCGTGILPVNAPTGRMPVPLRIKNYKLFNRHS